jgi:hypothetical protein
LVVDDAHENLEQLIPLVASFLNRGDYYVIEDVFLHPTTEMINKFTLALQKLGLVVDSKYADAFGENVTCSPNGWLVKQ